MHSALTLRVKSSSTVIPITQNKVFLTNYSDNYIAHNIPYGALKQLQTNKISWRVINNKPSNQPSYSMQEDPS